MGGQTRVSLDMIMVAMGIENDMGNKTFFFNGLDKDFILPAWIYDHGFFGNRAGDYIGVDLVWSNSHPDDDRFHFNQALDMNFFVSVFTLIISPVSRYSGI